MEKLKQLLDEYYNSNWLKCTYRDELIENELILSKKFWFIKWLVDNDKIDKNKIDKAERKPMYVTDDMFALYDLDECVIMLLSISELYPLFSFYFK